ncbi:uncharacterized protein LOC62_03G004097 [Vanrija pseudolonga]|uniref:Uncharacterized protein n=1 Tax=Vanrija pseudolonga TaxID=143232 RepID=A0AAF0Y5X8_9TREE|nr:hypothetical protein LOC62_03G004097 [Vanrija pseudolonga]
MSANKETEAYFEQRQNDNWRPFGKPYKHATTEAYHAEVKKNSDDKLATLEPLARDDSTEGKEGEAAPVSNNDIKLLRACLDAALLLEPQLRCPVKDDVDGWRRTLRAVFGDAAPKIGPATASAIARGEDKFAEHGGSATTPNLCASVATSVYGDKESGRFVFQPASESHVYVVWGGAGSALSPQYPPTLMERWIAAVTPQSLLQLERSIEDVDHLRAISLV